MVYIITGNFNQGKTTKLLSLFNEEKRGDGFYNRKVFKDDIYIGQEIVSFSTGESEALCLKEWVLPENWDEDCRYDVYSFSKKGLKLAEEIAQRILKNGVKPIYIDEIGPLELQGKGFCHIFKTLLKTKKEMFVVVRESCLESVINEFNIEAYKIIKVQSN